jgi:hypothetical protein
MSVTSAGVIAFDLMLLLVGFAWLVGLRLVPLRPSLVVVGFAFFIGWIASAVVLAVAVSLDIDPSAPAVVGVAAVAAALGLGLRPLTRSQHRPVVPSTGRRSRRLTLVGLAGAVLLAIAALTQLAWVWKSGADSSWDVWAFWEPKGRALYYFHGLDTGAGGATTFAHPDYPPLVPAMIAAQYHFAGGAHAWQLPFQRGLVSIGFLLALVALLRTRVPGWVLFPSLALLASAPRYWERMQSVLPDQLVSYSIAIAAVSLVLWSRDRRPAYLALATLSLAAAALTKNEGVMLGLALVVSFAVVGFGASKRRALPILVSALGPAAIIPWKLWLHRHGLSSVATDYSWRTLGDVSYLTSHTDRLTYGASHLLTIPFDPNLWTWVTPVALAALAYSVVRLTAPAVAIAVWLLLALTGQALVYWIGRPEIHYYVATSAERVVATLPIVAASVMPLLLAFAVEDSARARTGARASARLH